ncbi:MAG: biosynthetic-type acetolactate synthase large subunit [Deltaproteobacteria bacterium]|nr:biosynthetic-type acetolactate synthase large subunit [Deltaproteobacteria bacterium]MBI2347561.1 biosynthetic-type acetolactate synthase large subunit [Deltaproteobacteria bacterium]MBI2540576.1 biosynthetic-type acetolactate synthase large subunit [Deltaproteobacteria bacterium]
MKKTGAEIFVECLKEEGVKVLFGIPGGVVLKLFDVLHQQKDVEVILTRHEQGAAHMAEGYAKATGKAGVCLVTSGPGMTNIVTGLADAYMDSIPLVAFTGQVSTSLIGNDAFQEADNVGISRPCTKHNVLVKDVNDLARTIKEAFYIATTGRPGPVLVDIPKDVTTNKAEFKYPEKVSLRGYNPTYEGNKHQIKQAAEEIMKSSKPVIYVGGGALFSDAADEILELAEITQIPVTMTLMGLSSFPGTHALSMGMLGMHGSYWSNMAMHHADLLIAVGARFDDRVTGKLSEFCPEARVIHIDIDPTSIKKNVHTHIPIVGDVKTVLRQLNVILRSLDGNQKDLKEQRRPWWNQIEEWKRAHPLRYHQDDKVTKPQYVIEKLFEITKHEGIVATDVGQHQMWAAQYFKGSKPRTFITSGGLGTMGFGFPAALGAQKAYPDKLVMCITSEGSFQMNLQELATAAEHKLPVKIVLLNNGFHGMVRQWQDLFYEGRYASSNLGKIPDFVKLADAYGIHGMRAVKPGEVETVLREGLKHKGPVLMDFHVHPFENCYPMIPAGGAQHEMVLEDPPELRKAQKGGAVKKKAEEGEGELPA